MKLKFRLVEKGHKEKIKGEKDMLVFKPTLKPYDTMVKFQITSDHIEDVVKNLGLPDKLQDTIVLELVKKEEQTELDKP